MFAIASEALSFKKSDFLPILSFPTNFSWQAMMTAKLHEHVYPALFSSTIGILFIGTPHRGSDAVSKASLFAAVASHTSLQADGTILKMLEAENDALLDLLDNFVTLCNSPEAHLRIVCFFEQRTTCIGKVIGIKTIRVHSPKSEKEMLC